MISNNKNLLLIIEGRPVKFKSKCPNIEQHFLGLRGEFAGKTEACFELAKQIVFLRRKIDTENAWSRFNELLNNHLEHYVESLDTRWLISICDTFADYGSPIERSNALIISSMGNLIKLAETALSISRNRQIDPAKIAEGRKGQMIWDGMTTYHVKRGDMPRNLFARIARAMKETIVLEKIWQCFYARLKTHDTFLKQLNEIHTDGGMFN